MRQYNKNDKNFNIQNEVYMSQKNKLHQGILMIMMMIKEHF